MHTTCLQHAVTKTYIAVSSNEVHSATSSKTSCSICPIWLFSRKFDETMCTFPLSVLQMACCRGCQQIVSCPCHQIAVASQTSTKADAHHTLRLAFAHAGVASSSRGLHHVPTPFKFVQALAALGRPDAALAVLRARAHVSSAVHQSSEEAFQEAQTALSIRLQCGVFTEACSEV